MKKPLIAIAMICFLGIGNKALCQTDEKLDLTFEKILEIPITQGSAKYDFVDHGLGWSKSAIIEFESEGKSILIKCMADYFFIEQDKNRKYFSPLYHQEHFQGCLAKFKTISERLKSGAGKLVVKQTQILKTIRVKPYKSGLLPFHIIEIE